MKSVEVIGISDFVRTKAESLRHSLHHLSGAPVSPKVLSQVRRWAVQRVNQRLTELYVEGRLSERVAIPYEHIEVHVDPSGVVSVQVHLDPAVYGALPSYVRDELEALCQGMTSAEATKG